MRTDEEIMNVILGFAHREEGIRAVVMEGSRLNKNAPRDEFQDYDIVFVVRDMDRYTSGDAWLDVFGKRLHMQKPEAMELYPSMLGNKFSYIIIFEDHCKMDLTLVPLNELDIYFTEADSLTKVLLDKDGRCPNLPEASDAGFWVKRPSAGFVDDCANEFWMLAAYVMKGIRRKEPLYVIRHLRLLQDALLEMLSWQAGTETDFSLSTGKAGKYLDRYVSPEIWKRLMDTCENNSLEGLTKSLLGCCDIFEEALSRVSERLAYQRPLYGEKVRPYIDSCLSIKRL